MLYQPVNDEVKESNDIMYLRELAAICTFFAFDFGLRGAPGLTLHFGNCER